MEMQYSPKESGAQMQNAAEALKQFMGYDQSLHYASRIYYGIEECLKTWRLRQST